MAIDNYSILKTCTERDINIKKKNFMNELDSTFKDELDSLFRGINYNTYKRELQKHRFIWAIVFVLVTVLSEVALRTLANVTDTTIIYPKYYILLTLVVIALWYMAYAVCCVMKNDIYIEMLLKKYHNTYTEAYVQYMLDYTLYIKNQQYGVKQIRPVEPRQKYR